jgi:Kef-type K+ transport system membrane component KefB
VLLGIEFPPMSAEWTFFVAFAVILLGPLLVERFGLPGIVGVILGGGLLVVLGWVEREGATRRDAAGVASLPVGCSVGVPVRPRATAGFVHATATMVAGRAG